jgi:hypothetical protein
MFKGDIILCRIHGDPSAAGLCICLVVGEPDIEGFTRGYYRVQIMDCENSPKKWVTWATWFQKIDDVIEILAEEVC